MFENELGAIIRINRIQQNMSIRSLADFVGIEYSQLSKIERGLEFSKEITIESIFEALDLNYATTLEMIPICREEVVHIYQDLFYRKPKAKIKLDIDNLNQRAKIMGMSTSVLLINLTFNLLYYEDHEQCEEWISLLKKVKEPMTPFQKQIFYQYSGFYQHILGNSHEALNLLNQAEPLYLNDGSMAMIAYHKGIIYNYFGDMFEAYEHLNKAKVLFEQQSNYIRSAFCSVAIANVFLIAEKYEKAFDIYHRLLNSYEGLIIELEDIALICSNMLSGALLAGQFKQFFIIEDSFPIKIIEYLSNDKKYIFYRIVALYYTKKYKECLDYIALFEALNTSNTQNQLITYYRLKINAISTRNITSKLKFNFNTFSKNHDYNFVKLILTLIIKEYEGTGDYETLYHYALKLIHINT